MRVALTVARHSVTGVPRVQVRLAKELARRGFVVDLVVLGPWPAAGLNQKYGWWSWVRAGRQRRFQGWSVTCAGPDRRRSSPPRTT